MLPVVVTAQVAIEHLGAAGTVVGQFPVLDACFRPGPDLARARVYFRPEGARGGTTSRRRPPRPKADDTLELCRRATLPKPRKILLEKHVEY